MPKICAVSAHGKSQDFGMPHDGNSEAVVTSILDWLENFDHDGLGTGALDWTDESGRIFGVVRESGKVDREATASVVRAVFDLPCPHEFETGDPNSCSWCGADKVKSKAGAKKAGDE